MASSFLALEASPLTLNVSYLFTCRINSSAGQNNVFPFWTWNLFLVYTCSRECSLAVEGLLQGALPC
uniref:Uncharacterized protein n=1 Tax=Anguilla anguilla TaxID=7936 RepID=A0A0E9WCF6_ANGAN